MRGLADALALLEGLSKPKGRKSNRWCSRCGGRHAGGCTLVLTSYGTLCRPALRDVLEQHHADRQAGAR